MTEEFFLAVKEMRRLQSLYFKLRGKEYLLASIKAEQAVDKLIKEIDRNRGEYEQERYKES